MVIGHLVIGHWSFSDLNVAVSIVAYYVLRFAFFGCVYISIREYVRPSITHYSPKLNENVQI